MKTTHTPFFSVVITTYNRANLLKRALGSLFQQTEKSWNAVLIDDGSTDNTIEIVQPFLEARPDLIYFRQKHQGAVVAKNRGILPASGKYITFLDSDDELMPEHLASRKKILLKNHGVDLLHGGIKIIGNPYVPDKNDYSRKIHLDECAIGATFFLKKGLIRQLNGFKNIPLGSDADFLERATLFGAEILKTNLPTYIYHRENQDSITQYFSQKSN